MKINYLKIAAEESYKEQYAKKGLRLRAKPFIETTLPATPKRILVVGMALGGQEEVEAMNHYFPDYKIYGMDVIKSSLEQKIKAKLFYSDIAKIKIKDDFFSGVMCSAVMHEAYSFSKRGLKKVEKSVSEIKRVLCKNGIGVIREFFVPDPISVNITMLSKESKTFSKAFIQNFRSNSDKRIKNNFHIKGNVISTDLKSAYDLLLHFRVYLTHFKDLDGFLKSKEIEETYLPISIPEYLKILWKNELDVIKISYIDFQKYYSLIEKNFSVRDKNGVQIKNSFGFMDLTFRKN